MHFEEIHLTIPSISAYWNISASYNATSTTVPVIITVYSCDVNCVYCDFGGVG